jgi:EAL and modified HD-GYP domain-containing signal transduction protein
LNQHASTAATSAPQAPRELAVARQPILDAELNVLGYELLFQAPDSHEARAPEGQAATSRLIVESFMDIGLDELVGAQMATITVPRDFLMRVRPLPLPAERVAIQLLAQQLVDDKLLAVLREVVADGFPIVLDDFRHSPATEPLLALASTVKLDVMAFSDEELSEQVSQLRERHPTLQLLADNVEGRADFDRAQALGFDAYQGYFFAQPALAHGHGVPTQCLGALSAVASLTAIDDFESLEEVVSRDVGLSLRLLRYANSAAVFLPRRVDSVREALMIMGARQVRRWATVMLLAGTPDAPHQLLITGLARARTCQLLAEGGNEQLVDRSFTVGMFSVVDALVDAPMADVLATLPFSDDVVEALQERSGPLGQLLDAVVAYERGDFEAATAGVSQDGPTFDAAYREGLAWADGISSVLN